MSQAALSLAVRDRLQEVLELDSNQCDVRPDGRPKPNGADLFVSIHDGGWTGSEHPDYGISEYHSLSVTLTRTVGFAPLEDWGTEVYLTASVGLEAVAREVILAVHKSYTVLTAANERINDSHHGFCEPLVLQSAGPVREEGEEWLFGGRVTQEGAAARAALVLPLSFGQARRVQHMVTNS